MTTNISIKDKIVKNLKIKNSLVASRTYVGTFDRQAIENLVAQFQQKYSHKNLTIMLSINTPFGFRSAKQFNIHDEPYLVDDYEWDTTNAFIIYAWKNNAPQMGQNNCNSCLFDSIANILTNYRLPKGLKSDAEFKTKLGLASHEKVPLSKISETEKLFSININISGEYTYISKNKYNRTINLEMKDEHVEIVTNNNASKHLLNNIPCKRQKLIYYQRRDDKPSVSPDKIVTYDGSEISTITEEALSEKQKDFFGNEVYLDDLPIPATGDMVADYHNYIIEVDKIKTLTKGRIDLEMSGHKIKNEALKCVHYSLLAYQEPESITKQEQVFLMNCFKGGVIFSHKGHLDHAFSYDKNSAYPSILCNDHFTFPVKQGNFTSLLELPEILSYGIYRCIIKPCDNEHINKLFRFNKSNYYTHIDINLARTLGLSIRLICDENSNALLYTDGRANGAQYFKQVVHSLYELKRHSILAKRILNAIWGALSERNKIKRTTRQDINLDDNELVVDIKPLNGEEHKITYLKHDKYFKHSYARIGCFLTSAVRKDLATTLLPYKEHIHRCHTDGFISDMPLPLLISNFLGDYKLEKEGKALIENSNKIVWIQ